MKPYYSDHYVTLYHGDCRGVSAWLNADVMVTDPPYGIGWSKGLDAKNGSRAHDGIANDESTEARDLIVSQWGTKPAAVFGSLYAPFPAAVRHVLVWEKPGDAGVFGSTIGFRRDVEAVFLLGEWATRPAQWGSVLRSAVRNIGGANSPSGRTGHPHTKPVDVLCTLIDRSGGATICDPFAGSGSTLVAARSLGRRAIGVELEERYCEVAARRLSQGVLDFGCAV